MRMRLVASVLVGLIVVAALPAQNSTRKIRRRPSELAAEVGMGVPWRKDVDAALLEAKRTGKPVFWYVPAVSRSPMDRKPEIDRYMMGGPFSWPSTIKLLHEHFVPVKQDGGTDERSRELGLVRNRFIEPGYVVLMPDGTEKLKVDRISTFHPDWFEAPLRRLVGGPELRGRPRVERRCWQLAQAGQWPEIESVGDDEMSNWHISDQKAWWCGVAAFRMGQRDRAIEIWQQHMAGRDKVRERWGNKIALELDGHGPLLRGFEVYGELPTKVLHEDPTRGSRAPSGTYTEPELWQRGVTFLASMHDDDGVYRDSTYDFGGTDGLPNVHAAVTCLVGEALLAATTRVARGQLELPKPLVEDVEKLLLQIRNNAMQSDWLALSDRDEIIWARAYALRFLLAWQHHREADKDEIEPGIRRGISALIALQPETGVWFHEYGNPFAIATALIALHAARVAGHDVPQENIERGLKALAFNRTDEGAFSYGQTREGRKPRANVPGAAGRMPLCELALALFEKSDQQRLLAAIDKGLEHHDKLAAVRKYDDHADRLGYGGFFFWFDMLGRSEAIATIADADERRGLVARQHALIMDLPEFDGCFVDSHELGRCYGTAMALLCFDVCARAR